MFSESRLKSLLFFDIETAGKYPNYEAFKTADPVGAEIWKKKMNRLKIEDYAKGYESQVALYPEFGRIVTLSYGLYNPDKYASGYQVGSISFNVGDSEIDHLKKIAMVFHNATSNGLTPIGWNIKNFDVPWIIRQLHQVGLQTPSCLSTFEKKPWEVSVLDLKEIWKSNSSLDVTFEEAAYSMGIPTPKDDIDGSQVHETFWANGLDRIQTYCEKDVKTMIHMVTTMSKIYDSRIIKTS
jgi:hypothetical protein